MPSKKNYFLAALLPILSSGFLRDGGSSSSFSSGVVNEDAEYMEWHNATLALSRLGDPEAIRQEWSRQLEERSDGSNTKRMCVRALRNLQDGEYKMQVPDSDIDRYVPCYSCTPTR